jgi:hypothetical protein
MSGDWSQERICIVLWSFFCGEGGSVELVGVGGGDGPFYYFDARIGSVCGFPGEGPEDLLYNMQESFGVGFEEGLLPFIGF